MITAYFDATYNHPNQNNPQPLMHTVAAYLGTEDNWKRFRKEWRIELNKKGLKYFHMTDFEFALSRAKANKSIPEKNPFNDWKMDDFVPFQKRLHGTINRKTNGIYRLVSNASTLIKADFDAALPDELKENSKCSSYYIFNVWIVMQGIALWTQNNNYYETIHFIFSAGDGEGNNLKQLFQDLWSDVINRNYFHLSNNVNHSYEIQVMKDEPALQAADITAFECHKLALKWAENGFAQGVSDGEMRKSMLSLGQADHYGWVYRKEEILKTFADITQYEQNRNKKWTIKEIK